MMLLTHYKSFLLTDLFSYKMFHITGNYLVVFGGYSHRHNKEEICYDNQMYLYHLGCHAWVSPDILGESQDSQYPKQQGVFAHSASVRNDNTLLLVSLYNFNSKKPILPQHIYLIDPTTQYNKFLFHFVMLSIWL